MLINEKKEQGYYLFDGAFGTYYASLYEDELPCEMANLSHPKRVKEIHKQYCEAGCQAIKTNTFSANDQNLDASKDEIREIIQKGYQLAKETADPYHVDVFADIGPIAQQKNVSLFAQY